MAFIINSSNFMFDWLSTVRPSQTASKPARKTHDYSKHQSALDYFFEPTDEGNGGYMTAQGKGIKQGDYLILQQNSVSCLYQIEEVEYYTNPPEMWMAKLVKVVKH